jgi:hypothetical protein
MEAAGLLKKQSWALVVPAPAYDQSKKALSGNDHVRRFQRLVSAVATLAYQTARQKAAATAPGESPALD